MKPGVATLVHAVFAACAAAASVACSDAPAHATGGELRVGGDTASFPQHPHGCATRDGGALLATWDSLYEDCFGPGRSAANCGASGCHAESGTGGGGIWVCGATKESCYHGITTKSGSSEPLVSRDVAPETTTLFKILRKTTPGDGGTDTKMPQGQYNYVFTPQDLERIRAWIAAGAPPPLSPPENADAGADASK